MDSHLAKLTGKNGAARKASVDRGAHCSLSIVMFHRQILIQMAIGHNTLSKPKIKPINPHARGRWRLALANSHPNSDFAEFSASAMAQLAARMASALGRVRHVLNGYVGFSDLFRRHWDDGRGLQRKHTGPCAWTAKQFAAAMAENGCRTSEDAVQNWVKGNNLPRRQQMIAIRKAFFSSEIAISPATKQDDSEMLAAWEAANSSKSRKIINLDNSDALPENAIDWPRQHSKPIAGLAELELFTPQPTNDGGYYIVGRLVLGAREDDAHDTPFIISMREAYLSYSASENIATDGSIIGARVKMPHLIETPGGIKITGPTTTTVDAKGQEHKYLDGEVFEQNHILKISELEAQNDTSVSLTLAVPQRCFDVRPLDADGKDPSTSYASEAKHAIINTLLATKLPRDGQGRIILQKASIRKRHKP